MDGLVPVLVGREDGYTVAADGFGNHVAELVHLLAHRQFVAE